MNNLQNKYGITMQSGAIRNINRRIDNTNNVQNKYGITMQSGAIGNINRRIP